MEDEVEVIRIDRDLMHNLVLLVVEEVFEDLLLFGFVVSLSDQSLITELLLILVKEGLVDDFVENIWVFCVSNLLVNLPQPAALQ